MKDFLSDFSMSELLVLLKYIFNWKLESSSLGLSLSHYFFFNSSTSEKELQKSS